MIIKYFGLIRKEIFINHDGLGDWTFLIWHFAVNAIEFKGFFGSRFFNFWTKSCKVTSEFEENEIWDDPREPVTHQSMILNQIAHLSILHCMVAMWTQKILSKYQQVS